MLTRLRSILFKSRYARHDLDPGEVRRLEKAIRKWTDEKRYREYDRSRDDVAAQLNTSREFLNAYLTHVLRTDFNAWRTSLRIADAKKILLEQKDLPVSLVGEMVGISDRSNFHRQFTKVAGCSPKSWREIYALF
ncbi:MAG: AraC family transcriptional regulator [Bacteroidales bacterium]|nr:AraC family transcriptional regulator [Bacteroidales bacterium]